MRIAIDIEQAQREVDELGPEPNGWDDLTLNERIEYYPERYFAVARLAVSVEAPRQIADEEATRREIATKALKATQRAAPASDKR